MSSLEDVKFNLRSNSAISHARSAKMGPLNIQPMVRFNQSPTIAIRVKSIKTNEENHLSPARREINQSNPKMLIQIEYE